MPIRRHYLRHFSRRFSKHHNKWFAAMEQSGLSAANFIMSLLVLNYAGVGVLGEYGFWFALSEFSTMIVAGFAINQMVLHIANSPIVRQREVMIITITIVVAIQVISGSALWLAVGSRYPAETVASLAVPVIIYVASYNLSELTRQYLYMRGRQRFSLFYAAISTSLTILPFCAIIYWIEPESVISAAFWCLATAQIGYVVTASVSSRVWSCFVIPSKRQYINTGSFYWTHGRIAAAGMAVTWAQNKSINPMLQLTMDTVAAGLYQVARMIIMPINMINAGIARSAMADLRRAWGNGNRKSLKRAIGAQLRTSMTVVFVYLLAVIIALLMVVILGWKDIPAQLFMIFLAASIVLTLSNYRYWMSCHLVIQLQFAFLLKVGCVAAFFSLLWMLAMGSFAVNAPLVVLGSAVGELYMLVIFRKRYQQ